MAPTTTVYIVRHAEGTHQLPHDHPDINIRDPDLTAHGIEEALKLRANFPHHSQTELLAVSPMRRTIRTALIAFQPEIKSGIKLIALPDAQETTNAPSDVGSPVSDLQQRFGNLVDYSEMHDDWYSKSGVNAPDMSALRLRAKRVRTWLYERPESHIILVTHGAFAHFLTGNIDASGDQTGRYWENVQWREFRFQDFDGDSATFVETADSMSRVTADGRGADNETPSK